MRTNRWLIGGLVVSLIVNLLLVGFMVGRMSGFGPPPAFGPDPTAGFFRLLGFLDDDRRAAIAPDLHTQMGELMPVLRKMRGDQRARLRDADCRTVRPRRARAALAELRTNLTAAQVASHRSFVEMAKSLTPEEREELARAMRAAAAHARHAAATQNGGDHPPFGMHPGSGGVEPPQEDR